jgi:hypothetical protein
VSVGVPRIGFVGAAAQIFGAEARVYLADRLPVQQAGRHPDAPLERHVGGQCGLLAWRHKQQKTRPPEVCAATHHVFEV